MMETLYRVWGEGYDGWEIVGDFYSYDEAERARESYINSYMEEMIDE
ncbi:MAG: hypothetical protein ACRC0G_08855 [Fusobacteriaceae bacterium]